MLASEGKVEVEEARELTTFTIVVGEPFGAVVVIVSETGLPIGEPPILFEPDDEPDDVLESLLGLRSRAPLTEVAEAEADDVLKELPPKADTGSDADD